MRGPYISAQGDVISAALTTDKPSSDSFFFKELRILIGQIQKIYTIDTPNNNPADPRGGGIYTVYDVIAFHPDGGTEHLNRCRCVQPLFGGGINNYFEVVPTDPGPKAQDPSISRINKPGTWVLVGFINGQRSNAVILGGMPHPNSVAVADRPSQSEGTTMKGEFQGLFWQINNDGSLLLTFNGPRDNQGNLTNTNGPTTVSIDASGSFTVTTKNDQSVFVDQPNGVINVTNGKTEVKMEQNPSRITTTSDFLIANVNQDATVTSGGKSTVNATGDLTVSSNSKINLQRGADGSPSEPFVMGQKFKSFMGDFISAVAAITHIGNLGATTPPPVNQSQITALKNKLDDLLSDLIIGMK